MNTSSYSHLENTPLWNTVSAAIKDLKESNDLVVTTVEPQVIGYLVQKLSSSLPLSVLAPEECGVLHRAINKFCNEAYFEDWELKIRLGIIRDKLFQILMKL